MSATAANNIGKNVSADAISDYWKRNMYLPFVDHFATELSERLIDDGKRFNAQYLIPSEIGHCNDEKVRSMYDTFERDLPAENLKEFQVWTKGDKCLSPYSGDNKLYNGVIEEIKRLAAGQVSALVKFEGYGEEDVEEVDVKKLQKVNVCENGISLPSHGRKRDISGTSGLFSPLQGNELSDSLKAKFDGSNFDEDETTNFKIEKLSSILFEMKSAMVSSGGSCVTSNKRRKHVVAIGGETIKDSRNKRSLLKNETSMTVALGSPSPPKKHHHLEIIGGGQAKGTKKEQYTGKRLSDLSSIMDANIVYEALNKPTGMMTSEDDGETSLYTGFTDDDMEKPQFTFKSNGAKVSFKLQNSTDTGTPVQVPATLNQYLRDYQREGIQFLYEHYMKNTGAILGDDMGLGKTVQVIGFISALLGKQGNKADVMRKRPHFIRMLSNTSVPIKPASVGPFLIIGPGSVLYNWLEEFETWGYFTVRKYHDQDKLESLNEVRKGKVKIVVTTYETFREHLDNLNTIEWSVAFVDEVHKIKGMKDQTTTALRSIKTLRRFGWTGTALQNNLLEFWSILDWAQPGCLGTLNDFKCEFVKPIELGQRHDATKRDLAFARKQQVLLAEIRKGMMIRRMKSLIVEHLPRKEDSVVFCRLSQLQMSIYKTILEHPDMDYILHMEDPCGCNSGLMQSKCCKTKTPDGHSVKSLIFTFMHLLLKTSNHTALLIPTKKTSDKQAARAWSICQEAIKDHPEFVTQTKDASFRTLSDPNFCGKYESLLKVFCKDHSKVMIFLYLTQVLDILEQYLMTTGYEYRRIDGTVSAKNRMVIVREFNMDPDIFICLVSTKAGGIGLNLTGANKVIIFDPNWNPAHDLQAQDRAYRIGQRRNVNVYRLISTGTIEENMYLRQIYKQICVSVIQLLNITMEDTNARQYFNAVQGNKQLKGELFGIKNMFFLRTGEACVTRDIIKRNERVEAGLEGFETAQYIAPVVKIDDYEEDVDTVNDTNTSSESEFDLFAEFFSASDEDIKQENSSNGDEEDGKDSVDLEEEIVSKKKKLREISSEHSKAVSTPTKEIEGYFDNSKKAYKNSNSLKKKEMKQVNFEPFEEVGASQSETEKTPDTEKVVDKRKFNCMQFDQTLTGTFSNISDVFDHCGVVHIHENVKVVGGSRAEDHMTRCAITDVYVNSRNSQDFAAQCEPMPKLVDEEKHGQPRRGHSRKISVRDHNTIRSSVIGSTKLLIGQTPQAIKSKIFQEMCDFHNSGSLVEFAELVLDSNVQDRIKLINMFYEHKDPAYKDIHHIGLSEQKTDGVKHCNKNAIRNRIRKAAIQESTPKPTKIIRRTRIVTHDSCLNDIRDMTMGNKLLKQNNKDVSEGNRQCFDSVDGMGILNNGKLKPNIVVKSDFLDGIQDKIRNSNTPASKRLGTVCLKPEIFDNKVSFKNIYSFDKNKMHNKKYIGADIEVDADKLLEELAKNSEGVSDQSVERRTSALKNHPAETKLTDSRKPRPYDNPDVSVLDDLFPEDECKERKPPPMNNKWSSPNSSSIHRKTVTGSKLQADFEPFKEIDKIFSSVSEGNVTRVNFDINTLKDASYDCFLEPNLWKRRKKKWMYECDKTTRLTAESSSDTF